jgi:class 3 adenylate cyclase
LSQRALLSVIYPLLDGLDAVHKTGFLHRDIKPDNIYVRADGTPVLLDFGAARRVTANHDMTNIVSPGFAPFEQYHSQGNQGPWTDIYSLGAVMYWMTTGKKPVESAARVKSDTLLPAASVADAAVFGEPLLAAIDWAMQPDEARRPQAVAELRAAIQGSEHPATRTIDLDVSTPRASLGASGYAQAPAAASISTSTASSGSQSGMTRKNLLCTIMFLDLIGYSVRSVDDQVALKKLFNELIGKALKGVDESSRIAIDTGDGAAICFLGDPEEALHSAMLLRDLLGQRYGNHLSVRVGLHMGPVRVISDINERVNVVGDGINVAQRIMDFAQANQVLVSRAYYDVISRITDDTADLFQYLGQFGDKHSRLHEVYSVAAGPRGTTRREGPATGYTQTRPVASTQVLDPTQLAEVEVELARHIGPLAKVLVRKAAPLARGIIAGGRPASMVMVMRCSQRAAMDAVMGHQHQRCALLAVQVKHQLHHGLAGGKIQAAGGLVGQQHGRLHHKGPRQRHALLFATGQHLGIMAQALPRPTRSSISVAALRESRRPASSSGSITFSSARQVAQQLEALEHKPHLLRPQRGRANPRRWQTGPARPGAPCRGWAYPARQ